MLDRLFDLLHCAHVRNLSSVPSLPQSLLAERPPIRVRCDPAPSVLVSPLSHLRPPPVLRSSIFRLEPEANRPQMALRQSVSRKLSVFIRVNPWLSDLSVANAFSQPATRHPVGRRGDLSTIYGCASAHPTEIRCKQPSHIV
jgi:hypothetical protein